MNETPEVAAANPAANGAATIEEEPIPFWKNVEFKRFGKFFFVGILGAIIDGGTLNALLALKWFSHVAISLPFGLTLTDVGIAGTTGFVLAVTSNFLWNRFWIYPDSRSKSVAYQLLTFFVINTVGLIIRIPILELLSAPFGNIEHSVIPQLDPSLFGKNTAWALAVIVVMFWNFFVNRYWTYNDVK